MKAIGVKAKVQVCRDPLLGGVREALKWERLEEIVERYRGMVRIFLLIVDRDCDAGRRLSLDSIEERSRRVLGGTSRVLLAENAWQEVEVWVLAGMKDLPVQWAWTAVRTERDPKEVYFDEYARNQGQFVSPYQDRERLARKAAENYARIRQLCPEDVASLHARLASALAT